MKKRIVPILLTMSMIISMFTLEALAATNASSGKSEPEKKDITTARLSESETITRAEWIHELVEIFDLAINKNEYPDNYYSDITEESECFADVMAATWNGIISIEAGDPFEPEAPLTREFAAQTLNHELGVLREQKNNSFSDANEVVFPDAAQVAVEQQWMNLVDGEFKPNQVVTQTECDRMLSFTRQVLNDQSVEEAKSNYEFADYVIEIPEEADVTAEIDWEEEVTTLTIVGYDGKLEENDTFVYFSQGLAFVYSVASIEKSGDVLTVVTKDAPDDAIDQYECIGEITPEFEAVLPEDNKDVTMMSSEGETIVFEKIELSGVDHGKDWVSFERTVHVGSISGKLKAKVSHIKVLHNISSNRSIGIKGDLSISTTLKLDLLNDENAAHLPLGGIDLGGIGYIGLEMRLDMHAEVGYFFDAGIKITATYSGGSVLIDPEIKAKESGITAEGEVSAMIALTARASVPKLASLDASVGIGPTISAKYKRYFEGTPTWCLTEEGYLKAEASAKAKFFLLGTYSDTIDIYNEYNSPVRVYVHVEDGVEVMRCTRPNDPGMEDHGYRVPKYRTVSGSRFFGGWSSVAVTPVVIWETSDNGDGTVTIIKYNGNATVLNIPKTIDDKIVSIIGKDAFKNKANLRIVSMPDTITKIGEGAFQGCTNLSSISLSKKLTQIGDSAFRNTAIEELNLPEGFTTLGSDVGNTFADCDNLRKVYIPSTIEKAYHLDGGYNNNNYLGNFAKCPNLKTIEFGEGISTIPAQLFFNCRGLEKVVIPDTVTKIEYRAFDGCTNLSNITLSKNLTEIGDGAFRYASIEEIELPEGLTTLGSDAGNTFANCDHLKKVYIPSTLEKVHQIHGGYENGAYLGNFGKCPNLKTVEFGEGIPTIPANLFFNCRGLENIEIPDTVTVIWDSAFQGCMNLSDIKLSDNLTVIGDNAFRCTALKEVKLPEGLTTLGSDAGNTFADCDSVKKVYIPSTLKKVPHIDGGFNNGTYQGNFSKCPNLKTVEFGDGITEIPAWLFFQCEGLESIDIPNTVTSIGAHAFAGSGLKTVTIPETVDSYGSHMFQNCTSLTSASLNKTNTDIPMYMFSRCSALTEIDLPENVTELKEGTFKDCTSLKTVDLPDLVQSIGKACYSGCTELESFKASNDLISIGNNCFQGDVKLTRVDLIDGLQTIGEYAFQGCAALEAIVLPDTVTSMGKYVFQKDTALNNVTLSKGLTELPSYAFANCNSKQFTSIQIPNGVKTIKDHAFYQDAFLKTFTIPASVTSIGNEAFSYAATTTVNGVGGSYAETYTKWKEFKDISNNAESISLANGKGEMTIAKGKTVTPLFNYVPEESTDVVTLNSDNTKVVTVSSGNMINGKAVGTANITATTTSGQTITFPVKVASLSSIEIAEKPDQLDYDVKEDKNLKGMVVNAVFGNGDTEQIYDYTVSGFTTDSKGVKTVTVSYADKAATFKINVGEKDIALAAHTISLTGNIGINYYFLLSDKVLNDSGAKVVFSMPNNKTSEVPVSKGSKRAYGDGYVYGFSCEVTSTQMTGNVTAKVVLSDGTESEEFPYTVKEYADIVIANKNHTEAFQKATPLMKAMLNYGAYAQQFFQYDDSVPANVDLKAEEKDVSEVTEEELMEFMSVKSGQQKGLVFQGSTLVLKSETSIRHYFSVESGYSINDFAFRCAGKELIPVASGKMYYVEIPNIASGDLDTMYEVTVGGFSIRYGALTYAYNMLAKTGAEDALKDLCRAMYLYNQAANEYFKK